MMNTYLNGVKLAQNLSAYDPTRAYGGDITVLANSLLNRVPYFLGGLAFFALLYSGFMYMTAYGDTNKMEQAKKNITWIIIGIIAVSMVSVIIGVIVKVISAGQLKTY